MPESPEARERRLERAREWKRRHASKHAETVAAYRKKHPERWAAQNAVAYALRKGKLVKGDCCLQCGRKKDLCAHHEDYSKPLEVTWLCRTCHIRHHLPQLWRGPRKSNASVAKITQAAAARIRQLLASGLLTNREIALLFGVTPENVSAIRTGKTWKHLDDDLKIIRGRRGAPPLAPGLVDKVRDFAGQGYTQAEISREVGISTASVSRILHGRKSKDSAA